MFRWKSRAEKRREAIASGIRGWMTPRVGLRTSMEFRSLERDRHGPRRRHFLATDRGAAIHAWVLARQRRKPSFPKV